MKDDFSQRSSALILISLVVLSLVTNYFSGRENKPRPNNQMIFPAYRTEETLPEADRINSAMPFGVKVDYSENWTLTTENTGYSWPQTQLYTPYYIYDGDKPVAMAGFNTYDGVIEAIDNTGGYKTALAPLLADSNCKWENYTPVINGFNNQICTMTATADGAVYPAILIYDIKLNSYFTIMFMPDVLSDTQVFELAKTVRIMGQ